MTFRQKFRETLPILLIVLALIGLYALVNWYVSPMRGLGEESDAVLTGLPDAITLVTCSGGDGGMALQVEVQPEGDEVYAFDPNCRHTLEKYVDGVWYEVSPRPGASYDWPSEQLEEGLNELYLPKGHYWSLNSGIYRLTGSFIRLEDGVWAASYTVSLSFVI